MRYRITRKNSRFICWYRKWFIWYPFSMNEGQPMTYPRVEDAQSAIMLYDAELQVPRYGNGIVWEGEL